MATRNLSPGGALLRASRLFSVPAPLPRPTPDLASTVTFNSETATLPHPTHLTITTPPSSLSKGDWGLKRPLPLRSTTRSSTPFIRIGSVDTIEHFTEYGSAADHTLTLQKWQEMNMPLSTPGMREEGTSYLSSRRTSGKGVFEEDLPAISRGKAGSAADETRWRFGGPWLAGITVGEFNEYVRNTVRRRKVEFRTFLRQNKALEDTKTAQRAATEKGEDLPAPLSANDITDEQLQIYLRQLRQDRSTLFRLVRAFLDFPPSPAPGGFLGEALFDDVIDSMGASSGSKIPTLNSEDFSQTSSPYAETGPPKTHPSAGLSYLRTNHHIYNHPVYGPQERPPPVQGRIILPKNATPGNSTPKVGIAGIVTDAPSGDGFDTSNMSRNKYGQSRKQSHPGLINIEPDKVGGSKIWLHPTQASIDANGRISLKVVSGDGPAVAVHEGKASQITDPSRVVMRPIQPLRRPPTTTKQGYGLESQDLSPGKGRNDKWGQNNRRRSQSDPLIDENEAMNTLRSLLAVEGDRPLKGKVG